MEELIRALHEKAGNFVFKEDDTKAGNISWQVEPGAIHSYEYVPLYFYNGLTKFFRE